MEKIVFCSDLHGNMSQYERVLKYARDKAADYVVFGGDLTPKEPKLRKPALQRQFAQEQMFPLIKSFIDETRIPVLMIMGNDDFISNHSVFESGQKEFGYTMIDESPYLTKEGASIIGYNYIPFTPFIHKCWERRDLTTHTDFSDRQGIKTKGVISEGDELVEYDLSAVLDMPSIEQDLHNLTQGLDRENLILVSHAPPHNTVCDVCVTGEHVGSEGLRAYIEQEQPLLTLHGHIHETVDKTGEFSEKIGRTCVITCGNDHRPESPYIVDLELDGIKIMSIERLEV